MIRLRTYQCLDAEEPEARRYLAVISTSGIVMTFMGATALDAQEKAKGWLQSEREKAQAATRSRASRRAAS